MKNINSKSAYRHLMLLSFLISFITTLNAQNMNLQEFNGWQFLKWEYSKKQVEDVLLLKGIEFDPGHPNQKQGPTTKFSFQDMDTRLAYDIGHLYDIQQYKYFGADDKIKADNFYNNLKSYITSEYGSAINENNDKLKKVIHIKWEGKFSKVNLYYNYSDKITKGFEDQTFSLLLQTNEL